MYLRDLSCRASCCCSAAASWVCSDTPSYPGQGCCCRPHSCCQCWGHLSQPRAVPDRPAPGSLEQVWHHLVLPGLKHELTESIGLAWACCMARCMRVANMRCMLMQSPRDGCQCWVAGGSIRRCRACSTEYGPASRAPLGAACGNMTGNPRTRRPAAWVARCSTKVCLGRLLCPSHAGACIRAAYPSATGIRLLMCGMPE